MDMDTKTESAYEWAKIPIDLPRENLVFVKAKTTRTTYHPEDPEGYTIRIFKPEELREAARSLAQRPVGLNHIPATQGGLIDGAYTIDANWNEGEQAIEALLYLPTPYMRLIKDKKIGKVSVEFTWRDEKKTEAGIEFSGFVFNRIDLLYSINPGDRDTEIKPVLAEGKRGLMEGIIQDNIQASIDDPSESFFKKAEESLKVLGEPFAGFKDWDACIAYAKRKGASNPEAYCGHIKAQAEPKGEGKESIATIQMNGPILPTLTGGCECDIADIPAPELEEAEKSNPEYKPPEGGTLPAHGKSILSSAYASCRKDNPDYSKERCSKIAWGAVKNAGYTKEDNKWVKKEAQIPEKLVNPMASDPAPMSAIFTPATKVQDPETPINVIGAVSPDGTSPLGPKLEPTNPDKNLSMKPAPSSPGPHDSKKDGDTDMVDMIKKLGGEQPQVGIGTPIGKESAPTDQPPATPSTDQPPATPPTPTPPPEDKDKKIQDLQKEKDDLQKAADTLQTQLKEARDEKDKAVKEAKEKAKKEVIEKVKKVLPSEDIVSNFNLGGRIVVTDVKKALREAEKDESSST